MPTVEVRKGQSYIRGSIGERIAAYTDKATQAPCWVWTGYTASGYGRIALSQSRTALAHRVAYELAHGPIPEGCDLDHLCRNRSCVNPDHLEPVGRRENLLRGETLPAANAAKTHCPRGHEYTAENTYLSANGRHRKCKACVQARYRARRAA